jgi:hypothetical protein
MTELPDIDVETSDTGVPDGVGRVRELERFAFARLPAMQLADGVFCHEVSVADNCRPSGRSLRYTIMVLLGLLRAEDVGIEHSFHSGGLRSRILSELDSEELSPGDFGLALWAESRMDGTASEELVAALTRRLPDGWRGWLPTMEAAWILMGLVESEVRAESPPARALLSEIRAELLEERHLGKGLLTHVGRGPRRRFPHFADQIYGLLAISQLARAEEDAAALELTRQMAERLISLQMRDGAWPWIYDPVRGTVVEPYELYSIHQDSMAMMGLNNATQATGDDRFRLAAVAGMDWNYGRNPLGVEMFDRSVGLIYRSIRRKRFQRLSQARSAAGAYLRTEPKAAGPEALEVNRVMRPYHLGWILEAWAGREHLADFGD